MVKGEWIVFPKEMRCKNWVNGIAVNFYFNEADEIEGRIQYVPPRISEGIPPSPNQSIFLFKMWRQATLIFKKAYYKKHPSPVADFK
jgi:hypothetical protein